jgi:hypothetical protein
MELEFGRLRRLKKHHQCGMFALLIVFQVPQLIDCYNTHGFPMGTKLP